MKRHIYKPKNLMQREHKGKVLYPHVIEAKGRLVFFSGQLSRLEDGTIVGKGDMLAQINQVYKNIRLCLASVGATMDDLVQTTTFTTNIKEYFKYINHRLDHFDKNLPTSTLIEISSLSSPDFLLEVNGIAVIDED